MTSRLVIFDFDGTLADSFGWFLTVLDDVAKRYRFRRVGSNEVADFRQLDAHQILDRLALPRWKVPLVAAHMRSLQAKADIHPFPGIPALLDDLSRSGLRLALVSSNAAANVRRVLGADTIARFDHLDCGAGLFGKAGRLKTVLRRAGIAAAQAIAIGDEIRDIDAARATGIAAGAVSWGYTDANALAARSPDFLVHSLDELRTLLLERPAIGSFQGRLPPS
ncbi:HAD hydrolase-like protein [Magnetospirillum molischianum]|uniref:HAD-superfamily hydrolase, subfamily IA, variant 1 n=1 Tax=Magnetospirillum molischianum DSM 120 TaxID=1150626 RepID=H8FTL9_MAGML|nr:HAD hydrolase-like protein [Magnetospirillum molischianum]CCG41707.1 HAD-superfamily hydrolase, subfamily IA, variant 1 [Magnetospirillum molischianum DSM 120]